MIQQLRLQYAISKLCEMLSVSESGYYEWSTRKPSRRQQEEALLEVAIKAAHKASRGTHGPKKLLRDLSEQGIRAGECRIRRIRKKLGIHCIQKKKYKATTDSKHNLPVAANLLNQQFEATAPNQIWLRILRIFAQRRDGFIWRAIRICSAKRSWGTRCPTG